MIHIAKPIIEEEEILHVQKVMRSGMIACGETVFNFEKTVNGSHEMHHPRIYLLGNNEKI